MSTLPLPVVNALPAWMKASRAAQYAWQHSPTWRQLAAGEAPETSFLLIMAEVMYSIPDEPTVLMPVVKSTQEG